MNKTLVCLVLAAAFAGGCASSGRHGKHHGPLRAVCVLEPTMGNNVHGLVTFTQMDGYVLVEANVTGLTPGNHGFHVHEFGDCSGTEALSAGGHYNPAGHQHAAPDAAERHMGDLGNLYADDNGRAALRREDHVLMLTGPNTIIGRSIIVHVGADDLMSQPTGNAGSRAACGVIGLAQSQ